MRLPAAHVIRALKNRWRCAVHRCRFTWTTARSSQPTPWPSGLTAKASPCSTSNLGTSRNPYFEPFKKTYRTGELDRQQFDSLQKVRDMMAYGLHL
jgi:hypothetical protein